MMSVLALSLLFSSSLAKISNAPYFYNTSRPLVIAHRGVSGEFPEHTVGAYTSAYFYGADYLELDLQITKDNYLVINHDPCLKDTTNVEDYEFLWKSRKGTYMFLPSSGTAYTADYRIKDFTLAELKLLKRKMRYEDRNQYMNFQFEMQTIEEVIDLALSLNTNFPKKDRTMKVGLYIELKDYGFYLNSFNQDSAQMLFDVLKKYDIETVDKANAKLPIIIQSFEKDALIKFATLSDLPLIQLQSWSDRLTLDLSKVGEYAHGIGPSQEYIFQYKDEAFDPEAKSPFVQEAHSYQLGVHPYTMKDDKLAYASNALDEYRYYLNKEVDGLFTEFAHTCFAAYTFLRGTNSFPQTALKTENPNFLNY